MSEEGRLPRGFATKSMDEDERLAERPSPVSVVLTPPLPGWLEEGLLRLEARRLASALATLAVQEYRLAVDREAAATDAAASARLRALRRAVLEEQKSRTAERGMSPRVSPLSDVHATLLWAVAAPSSSRRRLRGSRAASRPANRRGVTSGVLQLARARRRLRPAAAP